MELEQKGRWVLLHSPDGEGAGKELRALPGVKWHRPNQAWVTSIVSSGPMVELARRRGCSVPQGVRDFHADLRRRAWATGPLEISLPGGTLYPFQSRGVRWLETVRGRGLIADQMGLGKTVQALADVDRSGSSLVLVVCPAGLRVHWAHAIHEWLGVPPSEIGLYGGSSYGRYRTFAWGGKLPSFLVCSYALLRSLMKKQDTFEWDHLIFDESHRLKNSRSKRAQGALSLTQRVPHARVTMLSGTPMPSHPADLWHQLHILDPGAFPSWKGFTAKWCGGWEAPWGWSLRDPTEKMGLDLYHHLQDRWVLRRRKTDVLPELPPKSRTVFYADFMRGEARRKYERMVSEIRALREDARTTEDPQERASLLGRALGLVEGLRHATGLWKVNFLSSLFDGSPVLVFAWHVEVQQACILRLREDGLRVSSITADLPDPERAARVKRFQAGDFDALVLSIGAAAEGLTLTRAARTIFVQRHYSPSVLEQAEDRTHRIGQEQPTESIYLHVPDSIDDGVHKIVQRKRANESLVMDGKRRGLPEGLLAFDCQEA